MSWMRMSALIREVYWSDGTRVAGKELQALLWRV